MEAGADVGIGVLAVHQGHQAGEQIVPGELGHPQILPVGKQEWVKVESPITATAGWTPASEAPFAIVMEAPMSTQESMALKGALAPNPRADGFGQGALCG